MGVLLVIFGAGASFDSVDARIAPWVLPAMPQERHYRPPLANDLFGPRENFGEAIEAFPECSQLITPLRNAVLTGRSVEAELERIVAGARADKRIARQLAGLRLYLQRSIWQCSDLWWRSAHGITNYLEFVRRVEQWRATTSDKVVFVTFNYDILLEKALEHVADQGFVMDPERGDNYANPESPYMLIKPHGSVDWGRLIGSSQGHDDASALRAFYAEAHRFATKDQNAQYYKVSSAGILQGEVALAPAIGVPLMHKDSSFFECPDIHIRNLQNALKRVTRLIVVGWRAAEEHFMELVGGSIQCQIPLQVVSGSQPDAVTTRLRLPAPGGLALTGQEWEVPGGFSDYMRTEALEEFLAQELPPAIANL